MATDPVCGMTVSEATAPRADRDGQAFFFCSEHCRQTFLAGGPATGPAAPVHGYHQTGPSQSADPAPVPVPAGGHAGAIYTCPMHPQVEHVGPGTCPICGMALEPKAAQAGEQDDPELTDMTRRFRVAAVLTLPLFVIAMSPMIGVPPERWLGAGTQGWLQLLLGTPVVLWAGWPFFERGWRSVVTGHLNMFTLIALGTGAAYLYNLVAVLAPGLFPDSFRRHG